MVGQGGRLNGDDITAHPEMWVSKSRSAVGAGRLMVNRMGGQEIEC
jgi:hypothetical protein